MAYIQWINTMLLLCQIPDSAGTRPKWVRPLVTSFLNDSWISTTCSLGSSCEAGPCLGRSLLVHARSLLSLQRGPGPNNLLTPCPGHCPCPGPGLLHGFYLHSVQGQPSWAFTSSCLPSARSPPPDDWLFRLCFLWCFGLPPGRARIVAMQTHCCWLTAVLQGSLASISLCTPFFLFCRDLFRYRYKVANFIVATLQSCYVQTCYVTNLLRVKLAMGQTCYGVKLATGQTCYVRSCYFTKPLQTCYWTETLQSCYGQACYQGNSVTKFLLNKNVTKSEQNVIAYPNLT